MTDIVVAVIGAVVIVEGGSWLIRRTWRAWRRG